MKEEFYIATHNLNGTKGRWEKVNGISFVALGIRFFIVKGNGCWTVSEVYTGCKISSGRTKKEALGILKRIFDEEGKRKIEKQIFNQIKFLERKIGMNPKFEESEYPEWLKKQYRMESYVMVASILSAMQK